MDSKIQSLNYGLHAADPGARLRAQLALAPVTFKFAHVVLNKFLDLDRVDLAGLAVADLRENEEKKMRRCVQNFEAQN